ncbi:E3 ubiquitin-protein ligase [Melia azedarach]|uniref:E3 ubiquitin-protein ligase n=1 Tax=Melia azedarach TaxID=155640 RepID=A0ACC1X8I3_MELAZ|nr:E3 ubiquitin-protein ligase [Melia azedarach]
MGTSSVVGLLEGDWSRDRNQKRQRRSYEGTDDSVYNVDSREGNGTITLKLTDAEIFDCPICNETLTAPVFQCQNGHIACELCFAKIKNSCPSCRLPLGHNRNRAIEKVLQSAQVICKNSKYGCKETTSVRKKQYHEKECQHTPRLCPLRDCNFVGSPSQLCQHFNRKHNNLAEQLWTNDDSKKIDSMRTLIQDMGTFFERTRNSQHLMFEVFADGMELINVFLHDNMSRRA